MTCAVAGEPMRAHKGNRIGRYRLVLWGLEIRLERAWTRGRPGAGPRNCEIYGRASSAVMASTMAANSTSSNPSDWKTMRPSRPITWLRGMNASAY